MSEVLDLFGTAPNNNQNNNQRQAADITSTVTSSSSTNPAIGYNYVPEDEDNDENSNLNNANVIGMSPRQQQENEREDNMSHLHQNRNHNNHIVRAPMTNSSSTSRHNNNNHQRDITSAAFHQGQLFTFDQFLVAHAKKIAGSSLLVMFLVVFALVIAGSAEEDSEARCGTLFNGTCRGFLTLVSGDDWQLFGSLTDCPVTQKCVSSSFIHPVDNCSPVLDELWARPPRLHTERSYVEQSCCRSLAGVALFGFGEILLQALTTTLVGMFLNSPFPLIFFRWLREKMACCGILCCCFCLIAFSDDDSRDRLDSWYERNDKMSSTRIERASLVDGGTSASDDIEADIDDEENGFTQHHASSSSTNTNINTNTSSRNLPPQQSSTPAPSTTTTVAIDPTKPFQFTWIDYLFIPSTLFKYKVATQVILQAWIAIIVGLMTDGAKGPTTHTLGPDWFYRYSVIVSHTLNGGVFVTLVEFLAFVVCFHLIELRRTSIDPYTHRIESTSHFMWKLQTLFYTPIDSEGRAVATEQQQREAGATFSNGRWLLSGPGQMWMWAAGISTLIVTLPTFVTHILIAQLYFLPWLALLAFAFVGVFALIFYICDTWMGSFRPIYFTNSEEELRQQQLGSSSFIKTRNMRVLFAIAGRLIVVLAVNIIFLEVYLAPINGMSLTFLFGYQGKGYIRVAFDESSMHSSTCAMKYSQNENFGAVLEALLFYL